MKNFLFAVATLVGTIVGLGMFGIPYTVSKAGFFVGIFYLVVFGVVFIILHLMQGEICEKDDRGHRLTGFVEVYLGSKWKKFIGLMIVMGAYAGLLAYMIVGGKFLFSLTGEAVDAYTASLLFWLVLSVFVWFGLKTIGEIEVVMTGLLILFVGALFIAGFGRIQPEGFSHFDLSELFLPYGVILFAYSGLVAIPEIKEFLKNKKTSYRNAIILGSAIPIFIHLIFTFVVVGVSGADTTDEAIVGLVRDLGGWVSRGGAVFGIVALATSYLVLGVNLKNTFERDWYIPRRISGLLVVGVPLALFIFGSQDFIKAISFAGAVVGAPIIISIVLIYQRAVSRGTSGASIISVPKFMQWALIALFALGGVYEVVYLVIN